MECLNGIIGLSNRDCACHGEENEKPDDFDQSESGYFIDDMFENTGLFKLKSALECDDELWTVMQNAKNEAMSEFPSQIMGVISQYNEKIIQDWSGLIGDYTRASKVHQVDKANVGMYFGPKENTPMTTVMKINSIGLMTNTAGEYEIKIYESSDMVTPLYTIPITQVKANNETVKACHCNIMLPMFDQNTLIRKKYYISYELNGAKPLNTKFYCDCNSKPSWPRLVDYYGVAYDDDIDALTKYNQYTCGIVMNASFICSNSWLCSNWDYVNEIWPKTMAKAIQLMAILKTQQYILNSNNVNQYTTLLEPEHMMGKMKSVAKQIEGRMNYLALNLPVEAASCWSCIQNSQMYTPLV